jgi:hypothetical protein
LSDEFADGLGWIDAADEMAERQLQEQWRQAGDKNPLLEIFCVPIRVAQQ